LHANDRRIPQNLLPESGKCAETAAGRARTDLESPVTLRAPDRTDLKILDVLQQDARITNQALAERVALSPSACLARVRALETRGLIRAYRAHVAVDRIRSVTVVLAQVTFKQHALDEFTEFDRRILQMPEVVEACRISGAYDYLLRVVVNDVHHWKDIARLLLGGDYGVEKIVSHFLMDEVKPFTGYLLTSS
jgi:Lrp/AsnC family leucine-responsive transcriptional regulator